jgi:hypothetical protein
LLRFAVVLSDISSFPAFLYPDHKVGLRTMANREVYERLKVQLPLDAVVEYNPDIEFGYFVSGLFSNRQTFAAGKNCGTEFGGDTNLCRKVFPQLADIFQSASLSEQDVNALCRNFGISALVVNSIDPVWNNGGSWIWKTPPFAANEFTRAYLIGSENSASLRGRARK